MARVVFDGSAKFYIGSRSLNIMLEVGDNVVNPYLTHCFDLVKFHSLNYRH